MKYWYYTIKAPSTLKCGVCSTNDNEFKILKAIAYYESKDVWGCVVTFWHEITKSQFEELKNDPTFDIFEEDFVEKSKKDTSDEDDFVEKMYKLYPTSCPKRNHSLGKSSKDKLKIRRLLKTYSKEQIESVFRHEIDSKYGKDWMQNFSTFLNNFPDPECINVESHIATEAKFEKKSKWQS